MKLFLHSVYRELQPQSNVGFMDAIKALAETDDVQRHQLVDNPEAADCILLTEAQSHLDDWRYSSIRRSELVRRYREKTYIYCDADNPICILPGLYPSVPKRLQDPLQQRSFPYIGIGGFENNPLFAAVIPDLLFSFTGQLQNHSCRRQLARFRERIARS